MLTKEEAYIIITLFKKGVSPGIIAEKVNYSYDTITNLIKDYYHGSKIKKAKKMRDEEPQLYQKGNITMKCYKVKFLTKDELRRQMIIYAFNAGQAKALANSYPIDDITDIKVSETKAKKELIKMANFIDSYYGEDNLYKAELEVINRMRIRSRNSHQKGNNTMKESKRKYQKKLKSKLITFYLHEESLYQYAKTINFSRFVKQALKEAMKGNNHNG